ncbi:unnamed protein product [Vicia faba]|uniref:BED-type domain-containing protein n=1 Tax=Vicia faba TaxID=3906 RepID=A0AAV0YW96_VICFA|nr:unnamed protein product [Vicia faba]
MEGKEPTSIVMGTSNPSPPMNMNREHLDCKIRATTVVQDKREGEKNEIDEGRKKRKSIVWSYFTKLSLSETRGEHKAKCNHCRTIYSCDPIRHDTNSMNKHLHMSHKWIFNKVGKKATLHGYMPKINEESDLVITNIEYNLEDCRRAFAEFVICDEMHFKVVEGRGFRKLMNRLEPRFTIPSRCLQLFLVNNR